MIKGESIVIMQAANGYVVNPKEVLNMTDKYKDIYVFNDVNSLAEWIKEHFGNQVQQLKAVK